MIRNHDMNLKHSGKVSSLDVLDMRELRQRITLHRSISSIIIDDVPCVMVPYQENGGYFINHYYSLCSSFVMLLLLQGDFEMDSRE